MSFGHPLIPYESVLASLLNLMRFSKGINENVENEAKEGNLFWPFDCTLCRQLNVSWSQVYIWPEKIFSFCFVPFQFCVLGYSSTPEIIYVWHYLWQMSVLYETMIDNPEYLSRNSVFVLTNTKECWQQHCLPWVHHVFLPQQGFCGVHNRFQLDQSLFTSPDIQVLLLNYYPHIIRTCK